MRDTEIDFGPIEADVGYALGEIQDIREYVDGALADRLEGIEARLKEITDITRRLTAPLPHMDDAYRRLSDPFFAFDAEG